jgi:hypothetical protein
MKLFLAYILLMLASIAAADFDPNNLADDDLWNKLACKGGKLMAMATDDSAPQSKFEGDQKGSHILCYIVSKSTLTCPQRALRHGATKTELQAM